MEEELKLMLQDDVRQVRRYDTLRRFADWMLERELSPKTIEGYLHGTRSYLANRFIRIDPKIFNQHVMLPMSTPIPDELPTMETIQELIEGKVDPRLRALILLLASSGLRLQEALTTRMRDCTFDESPGPRIMLTAKQTKTKQPREAYLTLQAAEAIKSLKRHHDDYIFSFMEGTKPAPKGQAKVMGEEGYRKYMAEKKAIQMLRRRVRSLGKEEKVAEGHKFHKIHFHVLRKYVYTTAAHLTSDSYAHYLLGHKQYMGMYDLSPKEDFRKIYFEKLEKALTIGEHSIEDKEVENLKKEIEVLKKANAEKDELIAIKFEKIGKKLGIHI